MNSITTRRDLFISIFSLILMVLLSMLLPSLARAFDAPWDQGHNTTENDRPGPPPPPGPCGNNRGSPVYVATGDLIWSETDISIVGRMSLTLSRNYNSYDAKDGIFGKGWSANCEPTLIKIEGQITSDQSTDAEVVGKQGAYVLREGNGRRQFFTWSSDGSTALPPSWGFDSIEAQEDGTVKLIRLDGSYRMFDKQGRLLTEVDMNGVSMTYDRDDQGRLIRKVNEVGHYLDYVYNSTGHVTQVTDHSGRAWQYGYDTDGALISVTDPLGGIRQYRYQAFEIVDYGDKYNSNATTAPMGATAAPNGTISNYQQLIEVIDATGVVELAVTYDERRVKTYTEQENTYIYTYPDANASVTNAMSKQDSARSRWSYVYDVTNSLILESTDPANNKDRWTYNENSLVKTYTDKEGNSWEYTHDSLGRQTSRIDPLGRETRWEYEGNSPWPLKIISPAARETSFSYDTSGNPIRITDASGAISVYEYNNFGDLTAQIDPLGNRTEFSYNTLGLLESVVAPLGQLTQLVYDKLGRVVRATNAAGDFEQFTYDSLDRITSQSNALGQNTQYSFDLAGRVLSVTDGRGNYIAVFSYDEYGRKSAATEAGVEYSFSYNTNNTMAESIQGNMATKYQYDARLLPTRVTTDGIVISLSYDRNGRAISHSGNTGGIRYSYDDAGQIIEIDNIGIGYNQDGQINSYSVGDDLVQYGYSNRGIMDIMSTSTGDYSFQHDAVGLTNQIELPGGGLISYQYNATSQISVQDYSSNGGSTYQYTYDAAGHLDSATGESTHQYSYDNGSRLIGSTMNGNSYFYLYDENANRIEDNQLYDAANRLTEDDQYSYTYDERGNLIKKLMNDTGAYTDYVYNGLNQLVSLETFADSDATVAVTEASYRYDAMGRRVHKRVNNLVTSYEWMGSQLLSETRTGGTKISYRYAQAYSSYLPIEVTDGVNSWTVHKNHLDAPTALTNQNNVVVWQNNPDPYGVSNLNEDPDGDGTIVEFNFRFPGQYYDVESGLHYNFFRYYDPRAGRYITTDPIGIEGGINTYLYTNSNPTNFIDPTGQNPVLIAAAVRAAIAAAWRQLNRQIRRCAGDPICRCRAFYAGYKSLQPFGCQGCNVRSTVCCAVKSAQTAAISGVVTLRAAYIASNCDRHIPTTVNHPGELRNAQQALANCSAKASFACSKQCSI